MNIQSDNYWKLELLNFGLEKLFYQTTSLGPWWPEALGYLYSRLYQIPGLLSQSNIMFSYFSLRYKLWQRLWFDFSDLTQKSNVWFWIPLLRWPVLVAQKTVQCLNHICAIFSFVLAPTQLTLRFWSWKSWPIWLHRVTLASFCGNFNLTSQVLNNKLISLYYSALFSSLHL